MKVTPIDNTRRYRQIKFQALPPKAGFRYTKNLFGPVEAPKHLNKPTLLLKDQIKQICEIRTSEADEVIMGLIEKIKDMNKYIEDLKNKKTNNRSRLTELEKKALKLISDRIIG